MKHAYNISRLRELFKYNPETGILTRAGRPSGTDASTGHLTTWVDGRNVGVHRIAWALHYGAYPELEVDHVNGNGTDNRICNLRLATSSENNRNRRLSDRNKTGVKGVFRVKAGKPWRVCIGYGQRRYYITQFDEFDDAVAHANEMRLKLHGEFANAGVGAV